MNRFLPKAALLLAMVLSVFGMRANPVDMNTAREVGLKYINANTITPLRGTDDLQLVATYSINRGDAAFHVFNTPNGFVIVAADDCATPILGYSNEGQFDVDNIPIQLQDYLQDFVRQIEYGIENHTRTDARWALVRATGRLNENRDREAVGPLLTTTWGQSCFYNAMCPEDPDGPCGHVVTGCVATAMAQIMDYWSFPRRGNIDSGVTVYDWDNMPNSLGSSSSQEQINAVATLMWHCGVSVNMGYSASESAAMSEDVPIALCCDFNYSDEMSEKNRAEDPAFFQSIKDCLNQSRPVYYSADNGDTGHAFVCDGYNADDLLHFNWGWNGASDGFYAIDALANGFNNNHSAIFNIHPKGEQGVYYWVSTFADPSIGGTVSGEAQYIWGTDCTVTATPNPGYYFWYWMDGDVIVSTQPTYTFQVVGQRHLRAVFSTEEISNENIQFVDNTVKAICVANWDSNGDGDLSRSEAAAVYHIGRTFQGNTEILSFEELQYFTGINTLGCGSFSGCTGLTSIIIPNSVTAIGTSAFFGCSGLTGELTIPNSVTAIGAGAFYGCSGLTGVTLPNLTKIKKQAFRDCSGLTGNLTIPNTVTFIGNEAFCNCSGLTSLTIPNSVTSIGNGAFMHCIGLTGELVIPNSVTEIGRSAFFYCSGLSSVTFGNSVASIGEDAFSACNGLNAIHYSGDIAQWCNITFESSASNPLTYAHNLYLGDELLTEAVIPNTINSLGNYVFDGCTGLTSVAIPNSVTRIGDRAFAFCANLPSIEIPNSVTSIGQEAFGHCSSLSSAGISGGVATIDDRVFEYCTSLDSVVIPSSATSIGSEVFLNCSGLTSIEIPNSVTSIGQYAFKNCISLTSIEIPNQLTTIEGHVFENCSSLSSAIISASVTLIGEAAFISCSGLKQIYVLAETPPSLYTTDTHTDSYPFYGVSGCDIFVSCGSVQAYRNAQGWKDTFFNRIYGLCGGTVTASANPSDGGTVTGGGVYEPGSFCTLVAVANEHYTFQYWSRNGLQVSTDAEYTFGVTSNITLVANFCPDNFEINVAVNPVEGGTVEGSGMYPYGQPCTLTAIPADQYEFISWTENGNVVSTDANYTFVVTGGRNLIANFDLKSSLDINVTVVPEGFGVVTGAGTYDRNSTCTLTATANEGYAFDGWMENGSYVYNNAMYSFTVTNDRDLVAHFSSADKIIFADAYVKELCVLNWDTNGDDELSYSEAAAVTDLEEVFRQESQITSFDELQYFTSLTSIRAYAFEGCINMTSIVIPQSVTTIGDGALSYCGFTTMTVLPFTPPTLGNYAFYGVSTNISVYVPCVSLSAYQSANRWSSFSNFLPLDCSDFYITAIASPAEGGTVTGAGTYVEGTTCTLTATANEGFIFLNWTEDNEVISNDAVYSFIVSGDRCLVANFVEGEYSCDIIFNLSSDWDSWDNYLVVTDENGIPQYLLFDGEESIYTLSFLTGSHVTLTLISGEYPEGCSCTVSYANGNLIYHGENLNENFNYGFDADCNTAPVGNIVFADPLVKSICVSHWDTSGDGELNYTEAAMVTSIGIVFTQEAIISFNELQYFTALTSLEPRAFYNCSSLTSITIPNNVASIGSIAFSGCSSMNSITVLAETPPTLGSRAFRGVPIGIPVHVPCGTLGAYQSASGWNSFTNFQEDCGQIVTQTIDLETGWNWISTYIDLNEVNGIAMLEEALGDYGVTIQTYNESADYFGDGEWSGLEDYEWTNAEMVMVEVSEDCTIDLAGPTVDPGTVEIEIHPGWNWIGFPIATETAIGVAMAGFEAEEEDAIQSNVDGTSDYLDEWVGDVLTLVPGQGYMYYSNSTEPKTLVFSTTAKGKSVFSRKRKE